MDILKENLADLYSSEYPIVYKDSRKRLKLNRVVAGSFKKKLKILADAINELNYDIRDRRYKGLNVNKRIDEEISHIRFILKEMEKFPIGQVELLEKRRSEQERALSELSRQKRAEEIKIWSDISTLKRKRRELIMEYDNLLKTKEMIV